MVFSKLQRFCADPYLHLTHRAHISYTVFWYHKATFETLTPCTFLKKGVFHFTLMNCPPCNCYPSPSAGPANPAATPAESYVCQDSPRSAHGQPMVSPRLAHGHPRVTRTTPPSKSYYERSAKRGAKFFRK